MISGLIALIFDLSDTVIDVRISNFLVSLFNLIQGKELAGQERAIGAYAFASGSMTPDNQQRLSSFNRKPRSLIRGVL